LKPAPEVLSFVTSPQRNTRSIVVKGAIGSRECWKAPSARRSSFSPRSRTSWPIFARSRERFTSRRRPTDHHYRAAPIPTSAMPSGSNKPPARTHRSACRCTWGEGPRGFRCSRRCSSRSLPAQRPPAVRAPAAAGPRNATSAVPRAPDRRRERTRPRCASGSVFDLD